MPWMEELRSVNWSEAGWIFLASYALGCFTTGYYLVRLRLAQNIYDLGSGSVGARNVGRVLGWRGFVVTVLGDFGKGALAVWAARHFTTDDRLVLVAMLAVVAGHIWPVQLRGRGGKGMATSLGALLVYDWQLALSLVLLFAVAFSAMRRTVLPGLFAVACMPLMSWYLTNSPVERFGMCVLAALVLAAHRKNLATEFSQFLARRDIHPKHGPPDV
jgi:acyl phosphate:glycerol-3-phosphate acyltransferase